MIIKILLRYINIIISYTTHRYDNAKFKFSLNYAIVQFVRTLFAL